MLEPSVLRLKRGLVEALVIPAEGGVLSSLRIRGASVLAATPWAQNVKPEKHPAMTEADWVERWRGGWQLCFPSAGFADESSPWPQGFHGVASQASWRVVSADDDHACLDWRDEYSLTATRTWRLTDNGVMVNTVARNDSQSDRPVVIAEHLVLGGDLLAPVFDDGAELEIIPPVGTDIAMLEYSGRPLDEPAPWPGQTHQQWNLVNSGTPARVAALVDVKPATIVISGSHAQATVSWHGLPHALLWEELARSPETPWNGRVVALGVEPTSAAHGLGTAVPGGTIMLSPRQSHAWGVELSIEWGPESETQKERR